MRPADLAAVASIEPERLEETEAGRLDPIYDVLLALAAGLSIEPTALVRRTGNLDTRDASTALGQRLHKLRGARCMSQEDLARRTDMRSTMIGRFERGQREPRLTTILRLAHGLDVYPGTLLDELITGTRIAPPKAAIQPPGGDA